MFNDKKTLHISKLLHNSILPFKFFYLKYVSIWLLETNIMKSIQNINACNFVVDLIFCYVYIYSFCTCNIFLHVFNNFLILFTLAIYFVSKGELDRHRRDGRFDEVAKKCSVFFFSAQNNCYNTINIPNPTDATCIRCECSPENWPKPQNAKFTKLSENYEYRSIQYF